MAILRGTTHRLVTIKEVTYGVTPATPVMLEQPLTQLQKKSTQTVLRSAQLRSHPFEDRLLYGRFVHDLSIDFELQAATHDSLLETMFGSAISAKALVFTDALKSLSAESQASVGGTNFDFFTGWFFNKLAISASSSDTSPVKAVLTGVTKAATLDNAATGSTSVTAAGSPDPFVFSDATLTIAGVATAVVAGNFDITRVVDPLMLWGSRTPREYIPAAVTVTGSITVPYDDNTQSTIVVGFTDAALVFKFANVGATTFRTFTFPKAKITDIQRSVATRGGLMQIMTIEPYYNSGTSTVCTMTTE